MTTAPKRRTKTRAPGVFRSSSGAYEIVYRDSDGTLRSKVAGNDFEAAKRRAPTSSRRWRKANGSLGRRSCSGTTPRSGSR